MALDWLMIAVVIIGIAILGGIIGAFVARKKYEERLPYERVDAVQKSRSVLTGQFSEQLAPFLPGFPYNPTEVKFLGSPIDFVAFKGLDSKNPTQIVFVEVKTGKSKLSSTQQKLKALIEQGKVSWEEYRPL